MRNRIVHVLAVILLANLVGVPALSGGPVNIGCWPGDPGTDPRLCPPNDPQYNEPMKNRFWNFWSFIPDSIKARTRGKMNPKEEALGAIGMSIDRAWQYTQGRDDVRIAVLDSGIRWQYRDLTNKLYLNAGELPMPEGASTYDANGDGIFNIQDYANDSRVSDATGNKNSILDPEDLILRFSDGVDDDQNGYIDDISGYDFFMGDNDPKDDTDFGHGTRQAASSAGETNNGIDAPGVCPKCRVIPVRVGDSFVVEINRFAQGVVFATRSGAKVIQEALGSLNNTPSARAAIDFAYENKIPIVASAADEYSYHHNFPGANNHMMYVNSIRFDHKDNPLKATTFFGLNGCTNYGARVWVTVAGESCSSESTSRLSGIVGLLQSMQKTVKGDYLSAEEVYQLLRATADDLVVPEWDRSRTYLPAKEGFDQLHGYGRVNALRAVEAVRDQRIPPEADLLSPDWFSIVSPRATPSLSIRGSVRIPRAKSITFSLQYALGIEPKESDYVTVAQGKGTRNNDVIGELRFDQLPLPSKKSPKGYRDRDRFSVTIRLSATDNRGLRAESRRSFFVFDDPRWKSSFPIQLASSGEAGPTLVDLDNDGADEIILPTSNGELLIISKGEVHRIPLGVERIIDPKGAIPPARATMMRGVAVGDVRGLGQKEIILATRNGEVYAFNSTGEPLPGFPVTLQRGFGGPATPKEQVESGILSIPLLVDLDEQKGMEIVVSGLDGYLYAWNGNGTPLSGFPVRAARPDGPRAKLVSSPSVGDIDGDGSPEIIVGSNDLSSELTAIYAIRAKGNNDPRGPLVPNMAPFEIPSLRPELLPTIGTGVPMQPKLLDVDGDGEMEIIIHPVLYQTALLNPFEKGKPVKDIARYFSLHPGIGSEFSSEEGFLPELGNVVIADVDGNHVPEVYGTVMSLRILGQKANPGIRHDVPVGVAGWNIETGEMLPGYPKRMEDLMIMNQPIAADVDGDGSPEIIMGSGGYFIHAFKQEGEADSFPKFTGGWSFSPVALGDIDGDGNLDLVAVTREGWLFAWDLLK